MKKIILFFTVSFMYINIAQAEPFMDKALDSWVGYPLESVIKYWGYPDSQQTIAGKNIYIWEEKSEYQSDTVERSTIKTDKKGRTYVDTHKSGGSTYEMLCRKILEVNSDNIVSGYSYKGNICPNAYFLKAKKIVNPENNEWEQRKLEKQAKKRNY